MKKNRLAVNLYFLVNGFLYSNWVSRLPKFQEIYGLSNGETGSMLMVLAVGAWIAMPITGWIIVKNGSQKVTTISALLLCFWMPFIPMMPNFYMLAGLFLIMGMSTGIMDVAMNAQAVLVEEKYKKPIMSSFHAAFSIGVVIGSAFGAVFTKWQTPYFNHLIIIVLIAIPSIIWSAFNLVKEEKLETSESDESSGGFRMPTKALLGIGIIAFCCMLGEGAMMDWSTNYMKKIVHSDPALAPIGLSFFSGAMVLGRIFGDRGRIYFGDGKLLIVNSLIALSGLLVLILFPSPFLVIFSLFLIGLGVSVIVPIAYSTAGAMKELGAGVGISMVTTIGYAGFLIGPPIIGYIADWKTLRVAMIFVGILFAIMTIISFTQWRQEGIEKEERIKF